MKEWKKFLFCLLVSFIYKIFNIIERNDTVLIPGYKKPFRILDLYDNFTADVMSDVDPEYQVRLRTHIKGLKLDKKFFKESVRSAVHDKGWRHLGGIFVNVNTGEVLKRGQGSDGMWLPRNDVLNVPKSSPKIIGRSFSFKVPLGIKDQ